MPTASQSTPGRARVTVCSVPGASHASAIGRSGVRCSSAAQSRAIAHVVRRLVDVVVLDVAGAEPGQGQQLALDVDLDQVEVRRFFHLTDPEVEARVVPGRRVVDVVDQVGHQGLQVGQQRRRPRHDLGRVAGVPRARVGVVSGRVVEVVLDPAVDGVQVHLARAEADVQAAELGLVVPLAEEVGLAQGGGQRQRRRVARAQREHRAEVPGRQPEAHVSHWGCLRSIGSQRRGSRRRLPVAIPSPGTSLLRALHVHSIDAASLLSIAGWTTLPLTCRRPSAP
jgi:hypothetical protein